MGVDSIALRFVAILFLIWGISSIQQGQGILGFLVIVASLIVLIWADQDCIYGFIHRRKNGKPKKLDDEPPEIQELFQTIEQIGNSINHVTGRKVEEGNLVDTGQFRWDTPVYFFDRMISDMRSFNFFVEFRRWGPFVHLSVNKTEARDKLFDANIPSRHHWFDEDGTMEINQVPESFWSWEIKINEPGSWKSELDEYQNMIQWLVELYRHCWDTDQFAYFIDLDTPPKLDLIIEKARSTGVWPEVDEIVTV